MARAKERLTAELARRVGARTSGCARARRLSGWALAVATAWAAALATALATVGALGAAQAQVPSSAPVAPPATVPPISSAVPPGASGALPPAGRPLTAPDSPSAPAAVGPERYSIAWLEAVLTDYQRRYPSLVRLYTLGTSHEGRPVLAAAIGRGKPGSRPAVLLNGAHHGVELLSVDAVMDALEVLLLRSGVRPAVGERVTLRADHELDRRVRRWLDELVIWCVPEVNPDGVWAASHGNPRTGRKNGRDTDENHRIDAMDGVDLNRNYPFRWGALGEVGSSSKSASYYYRGPEPGSEPETQAMMRLGESEHFAAAISYHTGTVAVLAPYTIDEVKSPTPNEAWIVGEHVVAGLPEHPQKPWSLRPKIYSVDGTDQDYYRHRFGTVALLVEGARRDPRSGPERAAILRSLRATWTRLLDRFVEGPSLSGVVLDARGRPVVAEVTLAEQQTSEGEIWTTRCRDGRFDRFLPAPGTYTVQVRVPGSSQPPVSTVVEATRGRAHVEIRLDFVVPRDAARCPPAPRRLKG